MLLDIWVLGFCIWERLYALIPFLPCAEAMLLHGVPACRPPPLMEGRLWPQPPERRCLSTWPSAAHSFCGCLADDGVCGQIYFPHVVCTYMRTPLSLNWMPHSGVFTWSAASWITARYTGHSNALRLGLMRGLELRPRLLGPRQGSLQGLLQGKGNTNPCLCRVGSIPLISTSTAV